MIKSLGIRSDLMLLAHRAEVLETEKWVRVLTKDNPDFFFGNYLIFKDPFDVEELTFYLGEFETQLGEKAGIDHIALAWDDPKAQISKQDKAKLEAQGFDVDITTLMTCSNPLHENPEIAGIEIRSIASTSEWQSVIALQIETNSDFDQQQMRELMVEKFDGYKRLIANGQGVWLGAFHNDNLVGDLGIFYDDTVARFQNVETRPSFQRRGICRALVAAASQHTKSRSPNVVLVIEAEEGSVAEKAYRSFGFLHAETLLTACKFDRNRWHV